MNRWRRPRVQAAVVAVLGGLTVFALASVVFPYHTTNHDEAVYLQQAAMLLDGTFFLNPPVDGPFRPWFFVESDRGLYSKYTPVPAAMFAVGKLLGGYRVALALVATGILTGLYHTVREAFDARTGVLATVLMLASPLFLVDASVFLSYAPTTMWNLAFAASYLHADRTGNRKTAALAGLCIGIAFFARPYTAVLFATPFILHALWSLRTVERAVVERVGLTALFGLVGVTATLSYNAVVTGDPLVFPYQVFAPLDGLGFGRREILGYSRDFTPELSLRANRELLVKFGTEWVVAGPLGTLAAAVGVYAAQRRGFDARQLAVAGLFLTIPIGNLYFWGTVNMVGVLADPNDGLVRFLGPYYHFDLLVPSATFAAVGVLAVTRWLRQVVPRYVSAERVRPVFAVLLLLGVAIGGSGAVAAASEPISDGYAVTQQYEAAYEPFEERDLSNSVVFLPTTYGQWLNHPFQALRNDPSYDGDTVYAMQHRQFDVADAYPDRRYYRYGFRGQWVPFFGQPVEPTIQRVRLAEGETVTTNLSATVPDQAESVTIRLEGAGKSGSATVAGTTPLELQLRTNATQSRLTGDRLSEPIAVPTPDRGTVTRGPDDDTRSHEARRTESARRGRRHGRRWGGCTHLGRFGRRRESAAGRARTRDAPRSREDRLPQRTGRYRGVRRRLHRRPNGRGPEPGGRHRRRRGRTGRLHN